MDLYLCVSDFKKGERDYNRTSLSNDLSTTLGKHLQIYWEFIQEFQIVLSSLKERNSSKFFNLYHSSLKWRETVFCTSKQTIVNQETVNLLICKVSWTQGKGIPGRFRSCKGIYKVSGNLKWVTWELDVGTGHGRTSIKLSLHFLFPLFQLFYYSLLCLAQLKEHC